MDILITAALVALAVLLTFRNRLPLFRKAQPKPVAEVAAPAGPVTVIPPSPAGDQTADFYRLAERIDAFIEKSAHPRELVEQPDFRALVLDLSPPDLSLETLRVYATGANVPLACAALAVLTKRPDRDQLRDAMLARLARLGAWTLYFALAYLASLAQRPPVGAPIAMAQQWWADNLVIPDVFRTYLIQRNALGDPATFGGVLDQANCSPPEHIIALLKRIDHPYANTLHWEVYRWQQARIDRQFLGTIGRFWTAGSDKLLVEPAGWAESLLLAEKAVLREPPRSVIVSGEARVGKSAFLQLLGDRLAAKGWTVFDASGPDLMAGQIYFAQLEGRIRRIIGELDAKKHVAWHVGDLLQLAESGTHQGQSASVLDQLTSAIAEGRLVLLAEASPAGVTRLLQTRPSLRSLLEIYRLNPMSEDEAGALLAKVSKALADDTTLTIDADAAPAALQLSQQYLGANQLPGAAVDLLKRAVNHAAATGGRTVGGDNVLATLSQLTGLPRSILDEKERADVGAMRAFFGARVMGQDEAVSAIVERIAMLKAGLTDPARPVGVFLFAGPTGTGKTELAKTLAEYLFGSPERMARLDMSEFQTPDSTVKILGERGYARTAGDSLVERIRKQPFSVILLDEFEKAHPNVWDLFLQVFDDGRLSDANGRVADFRHAIVILTSNLGATSHKGAGIGFMPGAGGGAYSEDQVLQAIGRTFRPEFINRLDKVIVFQPLSRVLMREILEKELARVLERRGFSRRDWAVEWESSAIEFLLDKGFSPEMGARPLRRAIDQYLLAPLAITLVEHKFPDGDQFLFVRSNGRAIEVEFVDPDAPTVVPESPAAPPDAPAAIAAMILQPTGRDSERAALAQRWHQLQAQLAGAEWQSLKRGLAEETGAPDIWSRSDRQALFARRAQIDRVEEAARTVERLLARLESRRGEAASRELVSRAALQLYLVEQGAMDALASAPVEALLCVEPVFEAGSDEQAQRAWCARLTGMYRHWADRRHMQIAEIAAPAAGGPVILQIAGFGAFRTLDGEAGLHLLEERDGETGRRIAARVRVVPAPATEPKRGEAHGVYLDRLAKSEEGGTVIRRYRDKPAPLVRDARAGWRSGRLDAVLDGDFDLMGGLRETSGAG